MQMIPTDTKSDRVYEALREEIVAGRFEPGEKLIISSLAQQFGTSESPVREALKRLQEHRLIDMSPYTGYFVRQYSIKELEDLWMIRSALETLAIREIVERTDGKATPAVREAAECFERCVAENNLSEYRYCNKRFHMELYGMTLNFRLCELIDNIWEEAERSSIVFEIRKDRAANSVLEHRRLLEALADRDADRAIDILNKHRETNLKIIRSRAAEEERIIGLEHKE